MKTKEFYGLDVDRIFKTVLLESDDYELLNCVLTDVLEREITIDKLDYVQLPETSKKDKVQILDVLVRTKDNIKINVEVNKNYNQAVSERNLMYYYSLWMKNYRHNDEEWQDVKEIIQVNLNYNRIGSVLKDELRIVSVVTKEIESDFKSFKIINVNLLKYKRMYYNKIINGDKEHLYLALLASNKEEMQELGKLDRLAKEVGEKVLELNDDEDVIRQIELERDARIIVRKEKEYAREEGKEEGIKETQINTAKKLLLRGMDIKEVSEITNLKEEEIIKIQKEL